MTTFVLIPGAGTDPRIFATTIEALRGLGHEGIAPPLPLEDPEAGPSDHAEAILAALPEGEEVVVVAQSLGAFSGAIVAARGPVSQFVLLAPMIPAPGETAGEWWANTRHEEAIADLTARLGPMSGWGEDEMTEVFLHDVDPEVLRGAERYDGAPGPGMFAEPLPLQEWPDVPTRVLAPREDRFLPLEFQRRVARERLGLEVDEIGGGHVPMLSRPRELARRLVELHLDSR